VIIAHLADLHLGYRAYHRVTARGVNAREADVADAFRDALDAVVRRAPDLVLVAGDVFHTVRPSNAAIAEAFRQFSSLAERLPGVPIVIVAGNHDSPRSADTGNILALFREIPGVEVVTEEAQRVHLASLDTAVLCLPHNALARGEEIELEPDPEAAVNILMLHGTVSGTNASARIRNVSEFGGATIAETDIAPERWDYVALGHYHIATELAPNMWYAGGMERTSTNVWAEAAGAKGFVVYDTERRSALFQPVRTRAVLDLPRLSARGLAPAEVDAAIEAAVDAVPDGIGGKIVRLVVTDLPRHVLREVNHRRIRDLKAEALHFHLDARAPEVSRIVGEGTPLRRQTLEEQVETFLSDSWRPTSPDIDPARLVELARGYMDAAGEG
jgi:DNA repair exonuclease SbcCD nuclease subunit